MKHFLMLSTALIFFAQTALCIEQVNVYMNININAKSALIIRKFQNILSEKEDTITYTEVPRGLIVSIAEDKFFSENSIRLTSEGKELLNLISEILKEFNNSCAIESHTDETHDKCSDYKEDWEISIARANVITTYLIKNCHIDSTRLYPIGYGSIMPYKENVALKNFTDNRVDFVIFDYNTGR